MSTRLPMWFSSYIRQDDLVFGYVGERVPLMEALTERSIFRRVIDLLLPHARMSSLLKVLAGIPPLDASKGPTLGQNIIAALTAADLQRTLAELLARQHERSRSHGRYFEHVAVFGAGKTVFKTRFQDLQDKLITIQGHLIHRDAIAQYNSLAAVPVLKSQSQWFLADTPPHGQITGSPDVTGEYVLLGEEPGFTKTFGDYLPFCPDIGWYPNVRVTGFFGAPKPPLATLPTLRIGLVEYRAPFTVSAKTTDLLNFATTEFVKPDDLADPADSILFAYVAPILFRGSATPPGAAPPALAAILKQHWARGGSALPTALSGFYSSL